MVSLALACERGRPQASAAEELPVLPDSVAVTLEAPATVPAGAVVPFRLTLMNTTDRQVTLYLLGREITWDVTVTTASGATVWRRLDDSSLQEILAVRMLGPRERVVLEAEWPAAQPAGAFTATARVLTDRDPLTSSPVPIEVR